MKNRLKGFSVIIVLVIIISIGVFGLVGYLVYQNMNKNEVSNTETIDLVESYIDEKTNTIEEVAIDKTGFIEGSLTYPSDFIPESLTIFATNLETNITYNTSTHITDSKYHYGKGFKFEVPVGNYFVYGTVDDLDFGAYYDEAINCMIVKNSNNCDQSDRTRIPVTVTDGQTSSGVVVGDWYAQN